MKTTLSDGVWPTMITPFDAQNRIDYQSLDTLVDWYVESGVHGLFAVCASSEMFDLSLAERAALAAGTVKAAKGRIQVIASGHISDAEDDQITELKAIADTGVDALVLVTNRLATENENDDIFLSNLNRLISYLPSDLLLGFYECPIPYSRPMSEKVLRWCIESRRFGFLKDTCCQIDLIRRRLEIMSGTGFKLFNANSASLLESYEAGGSGFSGVMANFHPDLYVRQWEAATSEPALANTIQNFIGPSRGFAGAAYPLNAKAYLSSIGVLNEAHSRVHPDSAINEDARKSIEQFRRLNEWFRVQIS
jgi:4-hydroxy-tetrahydrodipicolinate synthase